MAAEHPNNASTQDTASELKALLATPDDYLVSWGSFKKLIRTVLRNLPVEGAGIRMHFAPTGIIISTEGDSGESDTFPFKISAGGEAGSYRIAPGNVSDLVSLAVEISAGAGDIVYLH